MDLLDDRPLQLDRVVLLGLRAEVGQVVGREVDAADEGDARRRRRRSCGACAAARSARMPKIRGAGIEAAQPHAGLGQRADESRREVGASRSRRPARRPARRARAASSSAACSSSPTLSSKRMKVSMITSRRAARIASNTAGKNASPFSSRRTRLPLQPARAHRRDLRGQRRVVRQVRPRPSRQHAAARGRVRCARRCGRAAAAESSPGRCARRGRWHARRPRAGRRTLEHAVRRGRASR